MAAGRLGLAWSALLLSRALVRKPRFVLSLRGLAPVLRPRPGWAGRGFGDAAGQEKGPTPAASVGSSLLPYGARTELNIRENTPSLEDLNAAQPLSPFEEIDDEEAVQILATPPLPAVSASLRDYVDQSETLGMLVQLGVDLSKLQRRGAVGSMLLRLKLQDVQERLLFLRDVGLQDSQLGPFITRNPFILTESIENLQGRVSYLRSKQFSAEAVSSMVSRAPHLLNFSIERLDNRLGFFQTHLGLSPYKTRDLVTRLPRLLCGTLETVKENLKVCALELGFRPNEIQHIVTRIPKVLTASKKRLTETFDYVHNTMAVPHLLIVRFPQVLNCSLLRIRERHLYLHHLGKAQYDPTQCNYVSLDRLVVLPDSAFCSQVASTSLEDFERFQKTL